MNREIILPFQNKKVKLVLDQNFVLIGIINQVYDDSILFSTNQATSLISFSKISQIISINGGMHDSIK